MSVHISEKSLGRIKAASFWSEIPMTFCKLCLREERNKIVFGSVICCI